MLGVLPFVEDPDLSCTAGTVVPQHLPPCTGPESETYVEDCIKKNTFTQEEVLHDVIFGRGKGLSLMNNESFLINEDFSAFFLGRYYTFNLETTLNTSWDETQMSVSLYSNFTYQLFIYNPKFFVPSISASLPTIQKTLNPSATSNHWHFLKLTEVEELNTTDDPCNDDPNYDFQQCVTESLSSKVSCECLLLLKMRCFYFLFCVDISQNKDFQKVNSDWLQNCLGSLEFASFSEMRQPGAVQVTF